ncbi:MAG TPA: isocitrate lyase/phosphoenolpyruvate mutase family protein [Pyrinomonadaceae bacterium]|nr:isocitrate lyase/phosphoenolpyruvate mutase family protein [Pyrinomonadaceae bacterium]
MNNQGSVVETFRQLHESGCFVLPNPWDAGSAIYLAQAGFKALATTSAGFAFSRGWPDGPEFVSREVMLDHFREIVAATPLPVNADFQNGYAAEPAGVAESVRLCVGTGVAGLSIEDSTGDRETPLYDFALAVERIKAARAAIDSGSTGAARANGSPRVLLTARCEAYLVGAENPLRTSLDRLVAFAEAGADCLYAPGVADTAEISEMVNVVAPKPVNVLVSSNNCDITVAQLADLGVRRISVGGALARAAWAGFARAVSEIREQGSFKSFAGAMPYGELTDLFSNR